MLALYRRHPDLVPLLLGAGALANDVLLCNNPFYPPLRVAACRNDLASAELLLAKGADLEAHGESGCRPLHAAALYGHTEMVQLLLRAGAMVDAQRDDGHTALMLAVVGAHEAMVESLLRAGADPTMCESSEMRSAVFYAAALGRVRALELMMPYCLGGDARRAALLMPAGEWAALVATVRYEQPDCLRVLLRSGLFESGRPFPYAGVINRVLRDLATQSLAVWRLLLLADAQLADVSCPLPIDLAAFTSSVRKLAETCELQVLQLLLESKNARMLSAEAISYPELRRLRAFRRRSFQRTLRGNPSCNSRYSDLPFSLYSGWPSSRP
jgi:hypothetical protein